MRRTTGFCLTLLLVDAALYFVEFGLGLALWWLAAAAMTPFLEEPIGGEA